MRPSRVIIGCSGLLSFALAFGSCGGGAGKGSPGNAGCDDFVSRLHTCGLIPQSTGIRCTEPTTNNVCLMNCVVAAPCDQLTTLACSQRYSGALDTCATACEASVSTDFTCRNGNTVGAYQRCDGARDCADGSDEDGCAVFTCKDGSNVVTAKRCNQIPDCGDGSDEDGCPTFVCMNAQSLPASQRCDGVPECSDGTDEDGCPPELASVVICQ